MGSGIRPVRRVLAALRNPIAATSRPTEVHAYGINLRGYPALLPRGEQASGEEREAGRSGERRGPHVESTRQARRSPAHSNAPSRREFKRNTQLSASRWRGLLRDGCVHPRDRARSKARPGRNFCLVGPKAWEIQKQARPDRSDARHRGRGKAASEVARNAGGRLMGFFKGRRRRARSAGVVRAWHSAPGRERSRDLRLRPAEVEAAAEAIGARTKPAWAPLVGERTPGRHGDDE